MTSWIWIIIGSGNGLLPLWHQAITWTNVDFLPIRPLQTNLNDILIKIQIFHFSKMHLKIQVAIEWPMNELDWQVPENKCICEELNHFSHKLPFCRGHFQIDFFVQNYCILIQVSLILNGLISDGQALVLIMAWCRLGGKPLSESAMVSLSDSYKYASQGLISSPPSAAYMCQWIRSALVYIMGCRLFNAKPLSKPMLGYCQLDPLEKNFSEIFIKMQNFSFTKMHLKISSAKWRPFCPGGDELMNHMPCLP